MTDQDRRRETMERISQKTQDDVALSKVALERGVDPSELGLNGPLAWSVRRQLKKEGRLPV